MADGRLNEPFQSRVITQLEVLMRMERMFEALS